MKVILESQHHAVDIIEADEILQVYVGNPETSDDIITVVTSKRGKLYCDCLNFDYKKGDYPEDDM